MGPREVQDFAQTVIDNVERMIAGQRDAIEWHLVARWEHDTGFLEASL